MFSLKQALQYGPLYKKSLDLVISQFAIANIFERLS